MARVISKQSLFLGMLSFFAVFQIPLHYLSHRITRNSDDHHLIFRTTAKNNKIPSAKPVRLEFVHIPKTGGTSVERAASEQGIAWGGCHFHHNETWTGCPPVTFSPSNRQQNNACLWHFPVSEMPDHFPSDPYDDLPSGQESRRDHEKKFFAIVRNPYEKMISEFYYALSMRMAGRGMMNSTRFMSARLSQFIRTSTRQDMSFRCGHFIPQYKFIYDERGRRIVHHVLKFENFPDEFETLLQKYSLNMTLPKQILKTSRPATSFSARHLSWFTMRIIETTYDKDFALGDYKKLSTMKLHPGDSVEVAQEDGNYLLASIVSSYDDETYDVEYPDGNHEDEIVRDRVRLLPESII